MDKDEKFLICGQDINIAVWEMDLFGSMTLKHSLSGHQELVKCLCLSKNGDWFISGGEDQSMRIWQQGEKNDWNCVYVIENEDNVNQILISNDYEQIISCHFDQVIKIWMKNIEWECQQILHGHDNQVLFITLSQNDQLLVSSQTYKLIFWEKGTDQQWQCKHQLEGDYHRLCLINNNELIVTNQEIGRFSRYIINSEGAIQLFQILDFDRYEDKYHYEFPMIFNEQLKLAIFRHFSYTYIMKQQENGDFSIYQKIYGNHMAGFMTKDGKTLILNDNNNNIQIFGQYQLNQKEIDLQSYSQQMTQQKTEQFLILNEHEVYGCVCISMDKDEKILTCGESLNVLIWQMNANGSIAFNHSFNGKQNLIKNLCFSKNEFWFLSGDGKSIKIWEQSENGAWICLQILENAAGANQILIANDDEQIISCHLDYKIRIWMKNQKRIWECFQILNEHKNQVKFISQNGQYLISSQGYQMILWQKGVDQKWQFKHQLNGDYNRICFTNNNEFIAISEKVGRLSRFSINSQVKLEQTIDFEKYQDSNYYYSFPMIFNEQCKLAIFRHFAFTYIMKQDENGNFSIHQKIYGNHTAGYMLKDGKTLILCDAEKFLQVWKMQ